MPASEILNAALSMALGDDDRPMNLLRAKNPERFNDPEWVDAEGAAALDSWYLQYRDRICRNFSMIEDYTTIAEVVVVSDNIAIVEVVVETNHPLEALDE